MPIRLWASGTGRYITRERDGKLSRAPQFTTVFQIPMGEFESIHRFENKFNKKNTRRMEVLNEKNVYTDYKSEKVDFLTFLTRTNYNNY